jgi:hypothetical protein
MKENYPQAPLDKIISIIDKDYYSDRQRKLLYIAALKSKYINFDDANEYYSKAG